MNSSDISIRAARDGDLPALVALANHSIAQTHAMSTTELQTVEGRKPWFQGYGAGRYRLLVAEGVTGTIGCADSSRYRPMPAFDATV